MYPQMLANLDLPSLLILAMREPAMWLGRMTYSGWLDTTAASRVATHSKGVVYGQFVSIRRLGLRLRTLSSVPSWTITITLRLGLTHSAACFWSTGRRGSPLIPVFKRQDRSITTLQTPWNR